MLHIVVVIRFSLCLNSISKLAFAQWVQMWVILEFGKWVRERSLHSEHSKSGILLLHLCQCRSGFMLPMFSALGLWAKSYSIIC
jgi:hypothetical protein